MIWYDIIYIYNVVYIYYNKGPAQTNVSQILKLEGGTNKPVSASSHSKTYAFFWNKTGLARQPMKAFFLSVPNENNQFGVPSLSDRP